MRWLDGITDSMNMSLSSLGVGDGQGGLVCCSPWGHKELDTTWQLNNNQFCHSFPSKKQTSFNFMGAVTMVIIWLAITANQNYFFFWMCVCGGNIYGYSLQDFTMTLALKYIKISAQILWQEEMYKVELKRGKEEKYRTIMCSLWASQVVLVVKNLSPNARDL